jgi:geranylgeranyl pyrophosphate synthase
MGSCNALLWPLLTCLIGKFFILTHTKRLNKPRVVKTQDEIQWMSDFYQRIGAIEYAHQTYEHLIEQANAHFMTLPESAAKQRLCRITSGFW